ncbi:MAG: PEP-CTERM-box response regulator transcription factor [bacterium]
MAKSKILVIDDEEGIRNQLKWAFSKDYTVYLADSVGSAKEILDQQNPDLVLLDISLTPDIGVGSEGIDLLQYILNIDSTIKVIMVTGNDTRENAIRCISLGAYDFYSKPINMEEARISIKRALYIQSLERENQRLVKYLEGKNEFKDIISDCEQMSNILEIVRRVATTDVTVLIQGESGTGKELIAKAIHYNSNRKDKPFVTINCGAIPETLLESELFGHEKGSFTDAHTQRKGRLEMAQGGTVFLDEITELPLPLQVKILRFLQEREIERIGGRETIKLDVRVLAATNHNVSEEIKKGTFREDLYYRLSVIHITLPPLRDRGDDVIILANAFLERNKYMRPGINGFSDESIKAIKSYSWPGNVRELENKVKRGIIMAKSAYITPEDLDIPYQDEYIPRSSRRMTLKEARELLEMNYVLSALKSSDWNVTRASEKVGVTRSTFYSLMDKYKIPHN